MKKDIKVRLLLIGFLNLFFLNLTNSQVGITNSGMTQEQERNLAGKGFDYGNKSGSALNQLENMTGQKVEVSNSNSARYNQTTVVKPALTYNQQMNIMVTGMIAESIISSLFNSSPAPKVQEVKKQPATLIMNSYEENQKIQNTLLASKHQKMMDLYKLLSNEKEMPYKSIIDLSMNLKPYLSQEDLERQKLIKKGISVTWDYNAWAQINPSQNRLEEPETIEKTNADKYLEEAINKIETLPGGVGRIPAVAGRFMVNMKHETMSYLKDASDAAISGNSATMDEVGNVDLRKNVTNVLYKTGIQTRDAYIEQGKDAVKGFFNEEMKETNFGLMKEGGSKLLENYKIFAPVSDAWKVSLRKY